MSVVTMKSEDCLISLVGLINNRMYQKRCVFQKYPNITFMDPIVLAKLLCINNVSNNKKNINIQFTYTNKQKVMKNKGIGNTKKDQREKKKEKKVRIVYSRLPVDKTWWTWNEVEVEGQRKPKN